MRHKWLACPPLEAQDCLMISIGIGMGEILSFNSPLGDAKYKPSTPRLDCTLHTGKTADGLRRTFPRLHFHFRALGDSRVMMMVSTPVNSPIKVCRAPGGWQHQGFGGGQQPSWASPRT